MLGKISHYGEHKKAVIWFGERGLARTHLWASEPIVGNEDSLWAGSDKARFMAQRVEILQGSFGVAVQAKGMPVYWSTSEGVVDHPARERG